MPSPRDLQSRVLHELSLVLFADEEHMVHMFENIHFAPGPGHSSIMQGLAAQPVKNVTLRNVSFPPDAPFGPCSHVEGRCEGVNRCPPCFVDVRS